MGAAYAWGVTLGDGSRWGWWQDASATGHVKIRRVWYGRPSLKG